MNKRIVNQRRGRRVVHTLLGLTLLGLFFGLSACESPIGPHADQETWVFEMTHHLSEEGGEEIGPPWSLFRNHTTPEGDWIRHETRLDRSVLTLHPNGTGTRRTEGRHRVDDGEWEVLDAEERDLHWGEWRDDEFQIRYVFEPPEIATTITRTQVSVMVRDRGARILVESMSLITPPLEQWVRVE